MRGGSSLKVGAQGAKINKAVTATHYLRGVPCPSPPLDDDDDDGCDDGHGNGNLNLVTLSGSLQKDLSTDNIETTNQQKQFPKRESARTMGKFFTAHSSYPVQCVFNGPFSPSCLPLIS